MVTDRAKSASTKAPSQGPRHALAHLGAALWRHRVRVTVWTGVLIAGVALGWASFLMEVSFRNLYRHGGVLNGWQNFLRQGAPWEVLVPVAVAGLLAFIGWWRLDTARPEPTLGLARMEEAPVGELRASLRRERRIVTLVLEMAFVLAALACCRFIVYLALALGGNSVARSTLMGVFLEALVWALGGGGFWLWRHRYLSKLETWGVRGD